MCAINLSALIAFSANAQSKYEFVVQRAENSFDHYRCAGLAGAIECLEEGVLVEGVESSGVLAGRILTRISRNTDKLAQFEYHRDIRLSTGKLAPIRSKTAIEEIGSLVQEMLMKRIDGVLQNGADLEIGSAKAHALLQTRKKYSELFYVAQTYTVRSEMSLRKTLSQDKDDLIAFCGTGYRFFESGTPEKVKGQLKLRGYYEEVNNPWVRSNHAFLLNCVEGEDRLYVYDSDDPKTRWPVTIEGEGRSFRISWRIDDHMGNGPSQQVYYNIQPLEKFVQSVISIVQVDNGHDSSPMPQ